jgi:hypothetical protein
MPKTANLTLFPPLFRTHCAKLPIIVWKTLFDLIQTIVNPNFPIKDPGPPCNTKYYRFRPTSAREKFKGSTQFPGIQIFLGFGVNLQLRKSDL